MKKVYIDANVLVYLFVKDASQHLEAVEMIKKCVENYTIILSTLCIDEFLFGFKKTVFRENNTDLSILQHSLDQLLEIENVELVSPPDNRRSLSDVLSFMEEYDLNPRDAFHVTTALYHEATLFATFDKDFSHLFRNGILEQLK